VALKRQQVASWQANPPTGQLQVEVAEAPGGLQAAFDIRHPVAHEYHQVVLVWVSPLERPLLPGLACVVVKAQR
jgi:hypothetical protein